MKESEYRTATWKYIEGLGASVEGRGKKKEGNSKFKMADFKFNQVAIGNLKFEMPLTPVPAPCPPNPSFDPGG